MVFTFQNGDNISLLQADVLAQWILKVHSEDENESLLMWVEKFSRNCYEASKSNLQDIDSPLFYNALEKAGDIIIEHVKPLEQQKKKLQEELEVFEYRVYEIEDKNHDNYMESNKLASEKQKLGIFKGAEKRALQEKIDKLRTPIEVPQELQKKIAMHKTMIEALESKIEHYSDLSKCNYWAKDTIMLKGENYRTSQKPQKAPQSQKKGKATNTSGKPKTSLRDKMKPIKGV